MRRITEAALATPKGRKKDFGTEMPKGYDPTYVEAAMCARPESLHRQSMVNIRSFEGRLLLTAGRLPYDHIMHVIPASPRRRVPAGVHVRHDICAARHSHSQGAGMMPDMAWSAQVCVVGGGRLLPARQRPGRAQFRDGHPAAQRDGLAAPGPRADHIHPGACTALHP